MKMNTLNYLPDELYPNVVEVHIKSQNPNFIVIHRVGYVYLPDGYSIQLLKLDVSKTGRYIGWHLTDRRFLIPALWGEAQITEWLKQKLGIVTRVETVYKHKPSEFQIEFGVNDATQLGGGHEQPSV